MQRDNPRWAPALPTLLIVLVSAALVFGELGREPAAAALGDSLSEGPIHLWSLWLVTEGLVQNGPWTRVADITFPEGFRAHLMDPVNLAVFGPIYHLAGGGARGATLAWNGLHAAWLALGGLGCWQLGRRLAAGSRGAGWAIALLTTVVLCSPRTLSAPLTGRSELLPALLYPLHLALLMDWLRVPRGPDGRGPGPAPSRLSGLGAALVLGLMANGGWYVAIFSALADIPLALWMARALPWREVLWRLGLVAALAGLWVVPPALALATDPDTHGGVFSAGWVAPEMSHLNYRVFGLGETLRLAPRRELQPWLDQVPYLSVLALALGGLGVWRWRRAAAGWWLVGGALLWASLGPLMLPTWEEGLDLDNVQMERTPLYYLLVALPPLREIHNWSRLCWIAAVPVGAAAMYGLLAVFEWRPRLVHLLGPLCCAAVLADHLAFPTRITFPRPTFALEMPADLEAALARVPSGALIHVPISQPPGLRPSEPPPVQRYLLWQLQHHRPISASYNLRGDVARRTYFGALVVDRTGVAEQNERDGGIVEIARLNDENIACARQALEQLRGQGYGAVLLHTDLVPRLPVEDDLRDILGEPAFVGQSLLAWSLETLPRSGLAALQDGACGSDR